MLGVATYDEDDPADDLLREYAEEIGVAGTYAKTRVGVFLGEPRRHGQGPVLRRRRPRPHRLPALRALHGRVPARRQEHAGQELPVVRGARGRADHARAHRRRHPAARRGRRQRRLRGHHRALRGLARRDRKTHTAKGVVVAAGALGTNRLLQACRLNGSLPKLSPRLGELVRTNSEAILAVTLPEGAPDVTRRVAITGSIYPDPETHIETVVYGDAGDGVSGLFTLLTGAGTPITRPLKLAGAAARHPVLLTRTLNPRGWSKRTVIILVMQSLDNAIALRARPGRRGRVRLSTEQDPERPNPTFIPAANAFAEWLAKRTGGLAQSSIMEAVGNIPSTAHILGGAVIGTDPSTGVVDARQRVFGYENLLVVRRRRDPGQCRRQSEPDDHGAGRARDESRRECVAWEGCPPLPPRSSSRRPTTTSTPTGPGS